MLILILLMLALQIAVLIRVSTRMKETQKPREDIGKRFKAVLSTEPRGKVLTEADFRKFLTKKKIQEKNDNGEEVNLDDLL